MNRTPYSGGRDAHASRYCIRRIGQDTPSSHWYKRSVPAFWECLLCALQADKKSRHTTPWSWPVSPLARCSQGDQTKVGVMQGGAVPCVPSDPLASIPL